MYFNEGALNFLWGPFEIQTVGVPGPQQKMSAESPAS